MSDFWYTHLPFPCHEAKWWDIVQEWRDKPRKTNEIEETQIVLAIAGQMAEYFETKHLYEKKLIFEDLTANPAKEIGDVFDVMGLDKVHIPKALTALKSDSQSGTFGPMGTGHISVTEEKFEECDKILKELEVPISNAMSLDEFRKAIYD